MVIREPQIISQARQAWQQAQNVGSTGRFLDAVMQKALTVSKRVRRETEIGNAAVSVPYAAVELTRRIFGTLENKKVLLLGARKMIEPSRMKQRIAGSLARELKDLPEKVQQEQMTTALRQLFHLQPTETALAGIDPKRSSENPREKTPHFLSHPQTAERGSWTGTQAYILAVCCLGWA